MTRVAPTISLLMLALVSLNALHQVEGTCSLHPETKFLIHSKRIVTPNGMIAGTVEVSEGKIVSISVNDGDLNADLLPILDFENCVIMPGLIDVHTHLNEPGRADWEGFDTGTRAAAAGGLTTLIDMPLNSYPTTVTKETLEMKVQAARNKLYVDVGFWGGLTPDNAHNSSALTELLDAGALGLKSFMCPSGINDFPMTDENDIKASLPVLAMYKRPILVHSEVPQPSEEQEFSLEQRRKYSTYLNTRPATWEREAVSKLVNLASDTIVGGSAEGAHIHIVHLSDSGETLNLIKEAKVRGFKLSVETCPHYLSFSVENIPDGDTRFKCAPPLRSEENRKKLWNALINGDIDFLSSDHSPAPPELKLLEAGDFLGAWGGISSLQLVLPITWTHAKENGVPLEVISKWWSSMPAKFANLQNKGSIEVGKDADFVVWDPETSFDVNEDFQIFHKHKITPYSGSRLFGRVIATFVRGQMVYHEGHHALSPCGRPILASVTENSVGHHFI
ncbi:hypothetical protein KP509_04G032900 [Ceratopteris richardii]|uniref:allantoinase n=1 Tax=Ceratopteris richardii TaxID=49495 RepID=A0A8T2UZB2_CERRI|nr:hypothetical protein KP509_04G032900 [Ceratopteris richardii]KAH7438835.1 hypothetical protein KP509_04G032900 [Ceratopteris richardii]